jgi:hypothetical protein
MGTIARIMVAASMIGLGLAVPCEGWGAEENSFGAPPRLDHKGQTGLSLLPGLGYRVIVPYQENKSCGDSSRDDSKRVCTNKVPLFMDLQFSFGVSSRIDLLMDLRFGLVEDALNHARVFALAPGIRVWLDQDVNLKFFTTLQAVYDRGDYGGTVPDDDFGLRNANGLMYDVIRNVGFFFQFGETLGFRRWFRMELDAGLGVQVRFP